MPQEFHFGSFFDDVNVSYLFVSQMPSVYFRDSPNENTDRATLYVIKFAFCLNFEKLYKHSPNRLSYIRSHSATY